MNALIKSHRNIRFDIKLLTSIQVNLGILLICVRCHLLGHRLEDGRLETGQIVVAQINNCIIAVTVSCHEKISIMIYLCKQLIVLQTETYTLYSATSLSHCYVLFKIKSEMRKKFIKCDRAYKISTVLTFKCPRCDGRNWIILQI